MNIECKPKDVDDEFKVSVCGGADNIKFSLDFPVHFSSLFGPQKMFSES